MKFAFCIGNGESRKDFDVNTLKPYGTVYGANAIFRDTLVDHLVCCDRRMAMETVSASTQAQFTLAKIGTVSFPMIILDVYQSCLGKKLKSIHKVFTWAVDYMQST